MEGQNTGWWFTLTPFIIIAALLIIYGISQIWQISNPRMPRFSWLSGVEIRFPNSLKSTIGNPITWAIVFVVIWIWFGPKAWRDFIYGTSLGWNEQKMLVIIAAAIALSCWLWPNPDRRKALQALTKLVLGLAIISFGMKLYAGRKNGQEWDGKISVPNISLPSLTPSAEELARITTPLDFKPTKVLVQVGRWTDVAIPPGWSVIAKPQGLVSTRQDGGPPLDDGPGIAVSGFKATARTQGWTSRSGKSETVLLDWSPLVK